MTAPIDGFTSPTLKHLRESWWDDDFTEFLRETLRPRPGNRILDVGCGEGLAEVSLGHLHISQLRLFGVDRVASKVIEAKQQTAAHNLRAGFAAADAGHLPFASGAFDSLYCVAVLQHIRDVDAVLDEFARVTAAGGRILAVEPDNAARYVFSSVTAGGRAFAAGKAFFEAATAARQEQADRSIGPKLPSLLSRHGIEPIAVRLFPVSFAQLGAPADSVWETRQRSVLAMLDGTTSDVRRAGEAYLAALAEYATEASGAGSAFVEIQHTMLFATVGSRA